MFRLRARYSRVRCIEVKCRFASLDDPAAAKVACDTLPLTRDVPLIQARSPPRRGRHGRCARTSRVGAAGDRVDHQAAHARVAGAAAVMKAPASNGSIADQRLNKKCGS